MRKYNPALKCMVDNYRYEASKLNTLTSSYTDEELFRVIEYWSIMSTADEQLDAVIEDIQNNVKR